MHLKLVGRRAALGLALPLSLLGATLVPGATPAVAVSTVPLAVSVAYGDTHQPGGSLPNPWSGNNCPSSTCTFVGETTDWDTGGIKIDNAGLTPATVSVSVSLGNRSNAFTFPAWNGQTVLAGGTLILSEPVGSKDKFDTSDLNPQPLRGVCGPLQDSPVPVVNLTVGGVTSSFLDTGLVLTTGGSDKAACPRSSDPNNESHDWAPIGHTGPTAPATAPSSLTPTGGTGTATLTWTAVTGATGYRVTPYVVGGASPAAQPSQSFALTSGTVTGLENGTTYEFTVAGISASGDVGPDTTPSSQVTTTAGVPGRVPYAEAQPGNAVMAPGPWPSRYLSLPPTRVLDTRDGTGGVAVAKVGAGQTLAVHMLGNHNIPASGVSAVVLNVTVADQTASSYLSVCPATPCGGAFSNLNFTPGAPVPNLVEATLGSGGNVYFFNLAGTVNVIADVFGYVSVNGDSGVDGHYVPWTPTRVLDTRSHTQGISTLQPGQTVNLKVSGQNGLPSGGMEAVVVNLTVDKPTASSYLSLWPGPAANPWTGTSNLNFGAGQTRANRVVVPLGADGTLNLKNLAGTADAIIDVGGYLTDGTVPPSSNGLYTGVNPVRAMDTRSHLGGSGTLPPNHWATLQVTGGGTGVPAGATAVVINLTATNPTAPGYLEVNATGTGQGTASDLNFAGGQTIPNLVVAPLDGGGAIHIYNFAGSTDVLVDVFGYIGAAAAPGAEALVTWNPANPGGSAITGYTVTATPGGVTMPAGTSPTALGQLSLLFTGLTHGTAYTFTVHATNAAGNGPESNPTNSATPLAALPGSPTAVVATATVTPGQVNLTWNAAGGSPTDYLVIEDIDGSGQETPVDTHGSATSFQINDTGLSTHNVTFTVAAVNGTGTGLDSAPSNSVHVA